MSYLVIISITYTYKHFFIIIFKRVAFKLLLFIKGS